MGVILKAPISKAPGCGTETSASAFFDRGLEQAYLLGGGIEANTRHDWQGRLVPLVAGCLAREHGHP